MPIKTLERSENARLIAGSTDLFDAFSSYVMREIADTQHKAELASHHEQLRLVVSEKDTIAVRCQQFVQDQERVNNEVRARAHA